MSTSVEIIPGPLVSEMTRIAAEGGLKHHPAIRKGAGYALEQVDGRWIAAVIHESAPPPFPAGGPADADEESPGPKSEGPGDAEPSEGPDDSGSSGDGDEDDDKAKKKKGGELQEVLDALHAIADALGVPLDTDSLVPGADEGPPGADDGSVPPPPPPGPPGPEASPGGPGGPDNAQHVIHKRVTKPGETPPGGTPIGAPAFASVREDHPWAHLAGKVASFQVQENIGDTPIEKIAEELDDLTREIGYRYKLREATDEDGNRSAIALITKH